MFLQDDNRLTVYNGFEEQTGFKSVDGSRPLPKFCCEDKPTSCKFRSDSISSEEDDKQKGFHRKLILGEAVTAEDMVVVEAGIPNELHLVFEKWDSTGLEFILKEAVTILNRIELDGRFDLAKPEIDSKDNVIAVGFIRIFIQLNYTGPNSYSKEVEAHLNSIRELSGKERVSKLVLESFEVDGVELDENVKLPVLIWLAKHFISSMEYEDSLLRPFYLMWRFRLDFLHQRMLQRRSWTLSRNLKYYAETYLQWMEKGHSMNRCLQDVHASFLCEISQMLSYYYEKLLSKRFLEEAMHSLGLLVEFTGKHGYRTKFQQTPLPQTVVNMVLNSEQKENGLRTLSKGSFPESLPLNDDTRLDRIALVDEEAPQVHGGIHQLILLGMMFHKQGLDETLDLDRKESEAVINAVIDNPCTWCGRVSALTERSRLEKLDRRAVDRSLRQLDHIFTLVSKTSTVISTEHPLYRQHLFFGSGHPTKSEIKILFGDVLVSLEHWKEALMVFSELNSFDHVVRCYQMMDLRHKAEELILQKIKETGETPKLLVLLGDVTSDISNYEKAWNLSSGKSVESQIKLGNHHFRRQEYPEAVMYFKRVVELVPLEYPSWIRLAWACYNTKDYETAYQAYLHAANLEYDNFQVWNNLANCALHLKKKEYALRAYKEAVKCSYDEWKVWNNILTVATDLGAVNDAIQAYHRILELNNKFFDEEILSVLVNTLIKDVENMPKTTVLNSMAKLMGRVTATGAKGFLVWLAYGRLLTAYIDCDKEDGNEETKISNFERGLQYYDKSLTIMRQNPTWKSDLNLLRGIVDLISEFRKKRKYGETIIGPDACQRLKNLDFMLRQAGTSVYEVVKKLVETVGPNESLQQIFSDICEEIKDPFYV